MARLVPLSDHGAVLPAPEVNRPHATGASGPVHPCGLRGRL